MESYKESGWSAMSELESELRALEANVAKQFGEEHSADECDAGDRQPEEAINLNEDEVQDAIDEEYFDDLYCVACNKSFKTDKALVSTEINNSFVFTTRLFTLFFLPQLSLHICFCIGVTTSSFAYLLIDIFMVDLSIGRRENHEKSRKHCDNLARMIEEMRQEEDGKHTPTDQTNDDGDDAGLDDEDEQLNVVAPSASKSLCVK